MSGHLVAKALQQRHPELVIRVTNTPGSTLNTSFLRGTDFAVVPFRPWAEQLKELAAVRLVLNTDLWWTRGRVAVDCAAAGVPCVGTTSDGQAELWPDLAAGESVEIDRLLTLAERALTDQAFRDSVVARARTRLASYTYPETIERFQRAVTLATQGRLHQWQDPVWESDQLRFPSERTA
jgi:glycosyltransferase involved in cell wall biosynthesis